MVVYGSVRGICGGEVRILWSGWAGAGGGLESRGDGHVSGAAF